LPLPLVPFVTVIQDAVLVAVQAQPVAAVTAIVPVVLAAAMLADVGAIVGAQGTPAWVTVNVLPPMLIVPVREVLVVLAATV
jgi:hypothetical protein